MQLVRKGFLANETFYKPAKHFQTIYLVSINFNVPFTELKLLYFKESYQNFKRKQSEKDQLSGLPRKAELYILFRNYLNFCACYADEEDFDPQNLHQTGFDN